MSNLIVYISIFSLSSMVFGILIYKVFDFFVDIFAMIINSIIKK